MLDQRTCAPNSFRHALLGLNSFDSVSLQLVPVSKYGAFGTEGLLQGSSARLYHGRSFWRRPNGRSGQRDGGL